jgi:hypothetical protein
MSFVSLMAISGIFWLVTYILIIKRCFKDKTYGMPLVALGLNLSWEFIYTFVTPHWAPYIYTNIIALSLDSMLFYQTLRFGSNEFSKLSERHFYLLLLFILTSSFSTVYFTSHLLSDPIGFHIAFWQNLLMSILFIVMLKNRDNLRGQSIFIGITKMIGTAFASIAFYIYDPVNKGSWIMNLTYLSIFIFDIIYIIMIYKKQV